MKYLKRLLPLLLTLMLAGWYACSPKTAVLPRNEQFIKVMSYNIHHCNPPSKPDFIDVDAIAKTILAQKPDIVALQEVDVNTGRSGNINEAALLAQKLKMNFFFAKAIDHDGGDYGVAILSKFKLSETRTIRLTTQAGTNGEPRVFATALITLPNKQKIRFGCTHLDAQRAETNRLLQAEELIGFAKDEKQPLIIAGDLNATPGSNTINIFDGQYQRTCQTCEFTIPVNNPKSTIDFIAFAKGNPFEVVSHQVIPERYASDHLPIVAVLKVKPD
jgi:endonuclease/exonuclease/phosphatase family metal-dependent hydrolase